MNTNTTLGRMAGTAFTWSVIVFSGALVILPYMALCCNMHPILAAAGIGVSIIGSWLLYKLEKYEFEKFLDRVHNRIVWENSDKEFAFRLFDRIASLRGRVHSEKAGNEI